MTTDALIKEDVDLEQLWDEDIPCCWEVCDKSAEWKATNSCGHEWLYCTEHMLYESDTFTVWEMSGEYEAVCNNCKSIIDIRDTKFTQL